MDQQSVGLPRVERAAVRGPADPAEMEKVRAFLDAAEAVWKRALARVPPEVAAWLVQAVEAGGELRFHVSVPSLTATGWLRSGADEHRVFGPIDPQAALELWRPAGAMIGVAARLLTPLDLIGFAQDLGRGADATVVISIPGKEVTWLLTGPEGDVREICRMGPPLDS